MACLFIDYLLSFIICSLVLVNASVDLEVNRKIWSQWIPDATGEYPCGVDKIGVVQCDENNKYLKIHACYCIYWDQDTNESVIGSCLITCYNPRSSSPFYPIERYSISNGTLFNEAVCSPSTSYADIHIVKDVSVVDANLNMDWQHTPINTPSVYRAQTMGIKTGCSSYFAVALLPLTVFYFLVVILRISFASNHLNGIVFALQYLLSPLMQRTFTGWFLSNSRNGSAFIGVYKISISIIGVLNLDFFRGVYPSFCLHVLLTLYDRNYHCLKLAWKPFKYLLTYHQRQWNIRMFLIETFVTFILLSSTKILSVSFVPL